jgi:hypothetical protein
MKQMKPHQSHYKHNGYSNKEHTRDNFLEFIRLKYSSQLVLHLKVGILFHLNQSPFNGRYLLWLGTSI